MVVGGDDFFNLDLIKRLPQDKYRAIILTTTPSANPIRQSFEDYAEVYDMSSFIDRIIIGRINIPIPYINEYNITLK